MNQHIRNGLKAGTTFAVIIIFLSLIGFIATAVVLLGGITGREVDADELVSNAGLINMTIFMALLGLWAGSRASQATEPDSWTGSAVSGVVAGAMAGFITGLYSFVIGTISASGADMRSYFAALGSDAVTLLIFNRSPIMGAISQVALLAVSGLVGALLARALGRGAWRDSISKATEGLRSSLSGDRRSVGRSPYLRYGLYAVIIVAVFALPSFLNQYWNYNMGTVGIYVLLGLGLNIVVGMAGLLDLGYVAFFAIGAYSVALLTAPEPHGLLWSFWIALPIGMILAAIAGIILGIPVLRMRGDYLAIVTLGFGEIIRILSKSDLLTGFSGGPRGVRDIAGPTLFGQPFSDERQFMYLIIIGCLLVIFVTARLQDSRVGRAWVAMREDETVAQAMGINTWQYKLMAFAIGAAFAGIGGVLFASRNQFTGPEDHNLLVSINVLSLVIVGGMGSIPGVIMGALALKGLPEVLRQLESFRLLAFGGLLVIMMILRPEGIWPSRRRQLELESFHHTDGPIDDQAAT